MYERIHAATSACQVTVHSSCGAWLGVVGDCFLDHFFFINVGELEQKGSIFATCSPLSGLCQALREPDPEGEQYVQWWGDEYTDVARLRIARPSMTPRMA